MKQSTQTLRSTYEELPEELLRGSEFKLGVRKANHDDLTWYRLNLRIVVFRCGQL